MLTIRTRPPNLDEFIVVPSSSEGEPWIGTVPISVLTSIEHASDAQALFGSARRLSDYLAPPNVEGGPDLRKLQRCLQATSELLTNRPAIPWELAAWGTDMDRRYWGIEMPVVRLHGDPLPLSDLDSGRLLRSCLVVASDPDNKLELSSTHKNLIKELALAYRGTILWNPPKNKVVQEMAIGYDLIIFIGHATYDPDDSHQNKFHLINDDYLTPHDLQFHLNGEPLVLFIACWSAQHAPQGSGPAAMPALGFMPACLDRRAVAFVGPLREITVESGLWLAKRLLQHLGSNQPGEALRLTRIDALTETPQDVTWAAFVVYQRPVAGPQQRWQDAIWKTLRLLVLAVVGIAAMGLLIKYVLLPMVDPPMEDRPKTFTITCAQPPIHTVQAGEPITLSAVNAIFIEPSVAPEDWGALTGTLIKLKIPGEENKFSYAPQGSDFDLVTFTFVSDEKTNSVTTEVLQITIIPERRGLCSP